MTTKSKSFLLPFVLYYIICGCHALWLDPRLCMNGNKEVPNCVHTQSGLCESTNSSQPCIGSDNFRTNNKLSYYSAAASCSLDFVSSDDCAASKWPVYPYDFHLPPFRLLLYRYKTWDVAPTLGLNLSLAADSPTGIKFFFEHQSDRKRRLCRKFTILEPIGYFVEDDYDRNYSDSTDESGSINQYEELKATPKHNNETDLTDESYENSTALLYDSFNSSTSVMNNDSDLFQTVNSRKKRSNLPHILFWDCLMFPSGFEGEDFYLRLSDEARWGAFLSFSIPTMERHDHFGTSVKDWSVFHYVHLEHVTLGISVPVTLQAAPFPSLKYLISLHHACCQEDGKPFEDTVTTDCTVCDNSIASKVVNGPNWSREEGQTTDVVIATELPYECTVGKYLIRVQIISKDCKGECYVSESPIFEVKSKGYGRWVVVTVVVLILLFLLSFLVMALIIRSQAEMASKKLWCRPHLLLICCPHSSASLSLITSLTSFLHHTAAVTTTSLHTNLADNDPYQWMLYELRTASKVVFLVPPRSKTVAKYSQVPQQWRLGVLCFSNIYGALSSATSSIISKHKHKFAVLNLECSGAAPPEIAHLQRFNLLKDMVSFVTWLHDGTFLDKWFLWRPLVTHKEGGGGTGTPYRSTRKKNSMIWSGYKRGVFEIDQSNQSVSVNVIDSGNSTRDDVTDRENKWGKGVNVSDDMEQTRPQWVNEILADKDETVHLPVIKNAFAPTFAHLQAAVKVVEFEEFHNEHKNNDSIPTTSFIIPKQSSNYFLRKVFTDKSLLQSNVTADDFDSFNLCDASMSSNATANTSAIGDNSRQVPQPLTKGESFRDSSNTLNNILPFSPLDSDVTFSELDDNSYGVPGIRELNLLGEQISMNDANSCNQDEEIEQDDDDFTMMLFGGSSRND